MEIHMRDDHTYSNIDIGNEEAPDEKPAVPAVSKKKKITVKAILFIQAAVVVFTLSTVFSKLAGMTTGDLVIGSLVIRGLGMKRLFFIGCEVLCLGIYAIFWQQIIKRFDLSVCYANRAFSIFWTFMWSIIIFQEKIRWNNVAGIIIVFIGIQVVNRDGK